MAGKNPRPGTKAYLKSSLRSVGWEPEEIEAINAGFNPMAIIKDLHTENTSRDDQALIDAYGRMRKAGLPVELVKKPQGIAPAWLRTLWNHYTFQPFWLSSPRSRRGIVFAGPSPRSVRLVSAAFVRDLWTNLADEPQERFPVVRRSNLLSWASAEGVARFESALAPSMDLAVMYGGILSDHHLHETFGYLDALCSSFKGLMLYEAVIPPDTHPEVLLAASWRAGFQVVLSVSGAGDV